MLNLAAPKSNTTLIALRIKNNSVKNNYSEPFWKGLSRNSWLTQACPLSPPVLLRGPGPRPCWAGGSAPPTAPFRVPPCLTRSLSASPRPSGKRSGRLTPPQLSPSVVRSCAAAYALGRTNVGSGGAALPRATGANRGGRRGAEGEVAARRRPSVPSSPGCLLRLSLPQSSRLEPQLEVCEIVKRTRCAQPFCRACNSPVKIAHVVKAVCSVALVPLLIWCPHARYGSCVVFIS